MFIVNGIKKRMASFLFVSVVMMSSSTISTIDLLDNSFTRMGLLSLPFSIIVYKDLARKHVSWNTLLRQAENKKYSDNAENKSCAVYKDLVPTLDTQEEIDRCIESATNIMKSSFLGKKFLSYYGEPEDLESAESLYKKFLLIKKISLASTSLATCLFFACLFKYSLILLMKEVEEMIMKGYLKEKKVIVTKKIIVPA